MQKLANRLGLLAATFAVFAALLYATGHKRYSADPRRNVLETFPQAIGDYRGTRQVLAERVYRILETDTVLVSRYANGGAPVDLSIVYFPEAKVDFHNPASCNAGTGDKVESLGVREVAVPSGGRTIALKVNAFSVERPDGAKSLFYYFYKTGEFAGESYVRLRVEMAFKLFRKARTSGALIVVSMPAADARPGGRDHLAAFLATAYPAISAHID